MGSFEAKRMKWICFFLREERERERDLQAAGNHAIDGVVTATADTNDLNLRGLHRREGASQPQRLGL